MTSTLGRHNKEWEDPLMGDKTWTALFDSSKIKSVAGTFEASQNIDEILADSTKHAKERLKGPSAESDEDRLIDRIIAAQLYEFGRHGNAGASCTQRKLVNTRRRS